MAIVGIGVGNSRWRRLPAWFFCAFAFIGLSSCIGGPGDECGGRAPSTDTLAALPSLAGCWSQGEIDTAAGYFSYELYCFSTDSTLLRSHVVRSRYNGDASELWGEFRMHAESPNRFSLELESAYSQTKYGGGASRVDSTYPTEKPAQYVLRGDSLVVKELEWCGYFAAKRLGKAKETSLELLAAYTQGPFGSRLRSYWDGQDE